MNMHIFQVRSNKIHPEIGNILIASPLLGDYHFSRSVILMLENNEEVSAGIVLNKNFRYQLTLNRLLPELRGVPAIPVYKGGPMDRKTIFFLHTFHDLEGAMDLGNGLYVNGDFDVVKRYILEGRPLEGYIRFYCGYVAWDQGQLNEEIKENAWMTGNISPRRLLRGRYQNLWEDSMESLGDPYTLWAKYPEFPSFN